MSNSRRVNSPAQRQPQGPNRSTPLVVALVVLLCIGGVVAIAMLTNGDGGSPAPEGAPGTSELGQTVEPSTSAQPSQQPAGLNCDSAPAPPGTPQTFDQAPDPSLAENATWTATIKTNCGDITVDLDGQKAPQTVASFLFLSEQGYYDDSPCHRLTTSGLFVLQCGDPSGSGGGGPGYQYGIENAPKDGNYPPGTLAMARTTDPNSNGSQFFIVYQDTALPTDGGGYSQFGKVTQGLDIVRAIGANGVADGKTDGAPAQPISILSISVAKK